jgi:hypothetical protein
MNWEDPPPPIATRACPKCEQPLDAASRACPECGVDVPQDLRVAYGTTRIGDLRKTSLLAGLAGSVFMIWIFFVFLVSMLGLFARLNTRMNLLEQVGFGAVFIALPGFLALLLLYRMPSRVRALTGDRSLGRRERWAWTNGRLWRDHRSFPDSPETLGEDATFTADARRGLLCLEWKRRDGRVQATLWIEGSRQQLDDLRAALLGRSRTG